MPGTFGLKNVVVTLAAYIQLVVFIVNHLVTDFIECLTVPYITDRFVVHISDDHFEIEIEAANRYLAVVCYYEFFPGMLAGKRESSG